MESAVILKTREYGAPGPMVLVVHGGPAAAGNAAPIARGLADTFHLLEPWQRGSIASAIPLTVAHHVEDMHDLILSRCPGQRPALIGESWGAMLVLAFAAAHPNLAGPLVIVGCGTWDAETRAEFQATIEQRINNDPNLRRAIEQLAAEGATDPQRKTIRRYELIRHLFDFSPIQEEPDPAIGPFDSKAHEDTWNDMLRLQREGQYPASLSTIQSPVLMLHGDYDPHPGVRTRDVLRRYIPHLEYRELQRCGHSPWRERFARDEFFQIMSRWIKSHLNECPRPIQ
jgi:pimeloyl-ACP methyl ester carboxylesterase